MSLHESPLLHRADCKLHIDLIECLQFSWRNHRPCRNEQLLASLHFKYDWLNAANFTFTALRRFSGGVDTWLSWPLAFFHLELLHQ